MSPYYEYYGQRGGKGGLNSMTNCLWYAYGALLQQGELRATRTRGARPPGTRGGRLGGLPHALVLSRRRRVPARRGQRPPRGGDVVAGGARAGDHVLRQPGGRAHLPAARDDHRLDGGAAGPQHRADLGLPQGLAAVRAHEGPGVRRHRPGSRRARAPTGGRQSDPGCVRRPTPSRA